MKILRPHQVKLKSDVYEGWAEGHRNILAVLATGGGKCLGRGTPIMMFDGTIKNVEDIQPGDKLIGPDSKVRNVLRTCTGYENLYRVIPNKGDSYVVNESHILSLRRTNVTGAMKYPSQVGGFIENICVRDYLKKSPTFKHRHKGWRSPVDFPQGKPLGIDPYFLGMWIGDGSSIGPSITTGDSEVIQWAHSFALMMGLTIRTQDNSENSVQIHFTSGMGEGKKWKRNFLRNKLNAYGLIENKHVPLDFKRSSRDARLRLLAGYIDADGHYDGKGYGCIAKSKTIAEDIVFVARSLGFASYVKPTRKTCFNNGVVGDYFRFGIYGNIDEIPCKIERKQASPRLMNKDVTNVGIKVKPIGPGQYYGFTIDGDHLFLLGDFTVTHNTLTFSDLLREQNLPSCVIAHRQELVSQISCSLAEMGVWHRIIGPKKIRQFCISEQVRKIGRSFIHDNAIVAVAGIDTLIRRGEELKQWLNSVRIWVIDECFPAGTMIDTPAGERPIETVSVGDIVTAFDETTRTMTERRVVRLFKNPMPEKMVHLYIGMHHVITCTAGHPFWTNRGWVNAADLTVQDEVFVNERDVYNLRKARIDGKNLSTANVSDHRKIVLRQDLFGGLSWSNIIEGDGGNQPETCVQSDEDQQPDAQAWFEREDGFDAQSDEPQTTSARRERKINSGAGTASVSIIPGFRVSTTVGNSNDDETQFGISSGLQSGLWESDIENSVGSGRELTRDIVSTSAGLEERRTFVPVRLDRIEVFKSRDNGKSTTGICDGYVYNFEVEDLHTYVANGIIVHNCHHVLRDNKWGKGVAMFPNAFGLGVTATPVRADKKSLGRKRSGVFDKLVEGPAMRWLIEQGYLCKYRVAGIKPSYIMDDSEITDNGDYSFEKLRKKAHASRIVGDIVDSYLDIAPGKLGLTFTVDVELAKDTAAAYRQKGVPAEALSGDTPDHIRVFHMERFRRGELKQLTNVDLFGEGLDVPGVEVVSDGRRTQSFGRYCQVFGRMLRPAEGKTHGIYIDHVGNAIQHKMPDRPRIWSLDDDEKGKKSKSPDDAIPLRSCVSCLWPYEAIYKCCPYCGHKPEPLSRSAPEHVDGDVTEYSEEFLQLLRGEISKANTLWSGTVNNVQQASMRKNMEIAHEVTEELKTCIAYWAGIERDNGLDDSQAYRKFYFIHGIDVMKAQMLDTADKRKMIGKIREEWI